jgi:hypothetical protein
MGALLVVPVLATVAIIGEYIRRRVLGLPAFDESEEMQFVKPIEKKRLYKPRQENKTYKGE